MNIIFIYIFIIIINIIFINGYWPFQPYIDVCSGLTDSICRNTKICKWYKDQIPWCYDPLYRNQLPPTNHPNADFVKKFFDFSFGVHLAEGTVNKVFYNMDHIECAKQCLKSANQEKFVRCLSFDFYPFEEPLKELPYEESSDRGICVLNAADSENARVRNEDQGFTDAELYYKSHYFHRPFSNLDGLYEVRNSRGGEISKMLDYDGYGRDLDLSIVWGGSRWGIHHITDLKAVADDHQNGQGGNEDEEEEYPIGPLVDVGYTPVTEFQHCAGLMTKNNAKSLCESTGGFLCPTQPIALLFEGRKLGCSYDGNPVWSEADKNTNVDELKFVRCCARYSTLIRSEKQCQNEFVDQISYCNSFKSLVDCPSFDARRESGFGRRLDYFRSLCKLKGWCRNYKMQDWKRRDKCLWCSKPSNLDTPDRDEEGSCRPASFGICENNHFSPRQELALSLRSVCTKEQINTLAEAYPDFKSFLQPSTNSPSS